MVVQKQALECQDTLFCYVGKDFAYQLYPLASLGQIRVVNDKATGYGLTALFAPGRCFPNHLHG